MSQINFFMLEPDVHEFFSVILQKEDMVVLSGDAFDTDTPPLVETPTALKGVTVTTIVSRALFSIYKPSKCNDGFWRYDLFKSPAIEFSIPHHLEDGRLISGRLFAKIGWLEPKENNRIYQSCYNRLIRWIKKSYHQIPDDWWVSQRVQDWSLAGGVLAFGSPLALSRQLTEKDVEA